MKIFLDVWILRFLIFVQKCWFYGLSNSAVWSAEVRQLWLLLLHWENFDWRGFSEPKLIAASKDTYLNCLLHMISKSIPNNNKMSKFSNMLTSVWRQLRST